MPQFHDLVLFIVGLTLGAIAAHFHPGTKAKKTRRRAIPAGTKETRKTRKEKNNLGVPLPKD